MAKNGSLESRRKTLSILKDKKITNKVFTSLVKRYESRKGGYIRIIKNGFRYGDSAPQAIIELVDRDLKAKGLDSGPSQKKVDNEKKTQPQDQNKVLDKPSEKNENLTKEKSENEEIAKKLEEKKGK